MYLDGGSISPGTSGRTIPGPERYTGRNRDMIADFEQVGFNLAFEVSWHDEAVLANRDSTLPQVDRNGSWRMPAPLHVPYEALELRM
jgi:hypothetical protein